MPEMSGATLVQVLRARHPRLRFLYMTGHADSEVDRRERARGGPVLPGLFTAAALAHIAQTAPQAA